MSELACHQSNGRSIAENNKLPRVFDNLIPTPLDFLQEQINPYKSLNIPRLSADHSPLLNGF